MNDHHKLNLAAFVFTLSILLLFFEGSKPISAQSNRSTIQTKASRDISCPLDSSTGGMVFQFEGELLRADMSEKEAQTEPLAISIKTGDYRVALVSYDDHLISSDDQLHEQWFLVFADVEGTSVAQTNPISDLPTEATYLVETVNDELTISHEVSSITAVHAAFPSQDSPNSVYPVCFSLTRVEHTPTSPPTIETTSTSTTEPPATSTPIFLSPTNTAVPPAATNMPDSPTSTYTAVPPTLTNTAVAPTTTNTPNLPTTTPTFVSPTSTNTSNLPNPTSTVASPAATDSPFLYTPTKTSTPVLPMPTETIFSPKPSPTPLPPMETNTAVTLQPTLTSTAVKIASSLANRTASPSQSESLTVSYESSSESDSIINLWLPNIAGGVVEAILASSLSIWILKKYQMPHDIKVSEHGAKITAQLDTDLEAGTANKHTELLEAQVLLLQEVLAASTQGDGEALIEHTNGSEPASG